jgi:hypothetical protein
MNRNTLVYILFYICFFVFGVMPVYSAISAQDSAPTIVEITGMLPVSDTGGLVTKNMVVELSSGSTNIVEHSFYKEVTFFDTSLEDTVSFRIQLDLSPVLDRLFVLEDYSFQLRFLDSDTYVNLPIAVVPLAIKSRFASRATAMADDQLLFVDDTNGYVGIGQTRPKYHLDVSGSVYVSEYYRGDGSQFTKLPDLGPSMDYYYKLMSQGLEHTVLEVDDVGKVFIGAVNLVVPTADMLVFGSLLFESNPDLIQSKSYPSVSNIWLWDSIKYALRVGNISEKKDYGKHSVGFGYNPRAVKDYSMVLGGKDNSVLAPYSIVSGGEGNVVDQSWSIIVGGTDNKVSTRDVYLQSVSSVILGGALNKSDGSGIVLGGESNTAFGLRSVVAGKDNTVEADKGIILGGQSNNISSSNSQAYGSYIDINHSNTIVFNAQNSTARVESNASDHIQFVASNGMGINTADTRPNSLRVSGNVRAAKLIGSAEGLINIQSTVALWTTTNVDNVLKYDGTMGVGTYNTAESLIVDGSIRLIDSPNMLDPKIGTIKFVNPVLENDEGDFFVFSHGFKGDAATWNSLTNVDNNTIYTATKNMVLDTATNTFYIATNNASIGDVMRYDSNKGFFVPGSLDRFQEMPLSVYNTTQYASQRKRLMLLDDISVGVGRNPTRPFDVYLLKNSDHENKKIMGYFFHSVDDVTHRYISFGLKETVEMNFQEATRTNTPDNDGGSGLKVMDVSGENELQFYVNENGTDYKAMIVAKDKVRINSKIDDKPDMPFYVDGDVRVGGLVFSKDDKSVTFKDGTGTVFLEQDSQGKLVLNAKGGIEFKNNENNFYYRALLFGNYDNVPAFGVGNISSLRGALDVSNGNIHVAKGVSFFDTSVDPKSTISFNGTDPIQFKLNDSLHVSVGVTGNVSFFGTVSNADMLIQQNGIDNSMILESGMDSLNPRLSFAHSDNTASFNIVLASKQLQFKMGDTAYMSISSSKNVGIHDQNPAYPLSIGVPITLKDSLFVGNQTNKISKDATGTEVGTGIDIDSGSQVIVSTNAVEHALVVDSGKVFVNDNTFSDTDVMFYVNGNMLVTGNILDANGDKIFPLSVKSVGGTFSSTINTIVIDESNASSLILELDHTNNKAVVGYPGFVDTIKVGNQTISATDVDMFTIRAGQGMKLETSGHTNTLIDKLQIAGEIVVIDQDITVYGSVTANAFTGDASEMVNIPFRWHKTGAVVTTNYNVGIGTASNSNYKLKVEGAVSANQLIATNVTVPMLSSLASLNVMAKGLRFNNTVNFYKKSGFQSILKTDKWGVGAEDPLYTLDIVSNSGSLNIGSNNDEYVLEFKVTDKGLLTLSQDSSIVSLNANQPFFVDVNDDDMYELYIKNSAIKQLGFGVQDTGLNILGNNPGVVVGKALSLGDKLNIDAGFSVTLNGLSLMVGDMDVPSDFSAMSVSAMSVFGSMVLGNEILGDNDRLYNNGSVYIAPDLTMHVGATRSATTEPVPALYVDGQTHVNGTLQAGDVTLSGDSNFAYIKGSNQKDLVFSGKTGVLVSAASNDLFVDNNNKVGLNTQSPGASLHVKDASGMANVRLQKGDSKVMFTNESNTSIKKAVIARGTGSSSETVLNIRAGSHDLDTTKGLVLSKKDGTHRVGINKLPDNNDKTLQVSGNVDAGAYIVQDKLATNSKTDSARKYSHGGYSNFGTVPIGTILIWTDEDNIPVGWLLCDGSSYLHNGETKNVPDLTNRFIKSVSVNASNCDSDTPGCAGYEGGTNNVTTTSTSHLHGEAQHANHDFYDNNEKHDHGLSELSSDSWAVINGGSGFDDAMTNSQLTGAHTQEDFNFEKAVVQWFINQGHHIYNNHILVGSYDYCVHYRGRNGGYCAPDTTNWDSVKNGESAFAYDSSTGSNGRFGQPYNIDPGNHNHETKGHSHDNGFSSVSANVTHTVTANTHEHSDGEHAHIVNNKPKRTNAVIFIMYVGGDT